MFGAMTSSMSKGIAILVIAGLGGGLLLWRYHGQRAQRPQPESGHVDESRSNREVRGTVLIPAEGDGWLWSRRVSSAISQTGTNALPSLLTLITQKQDKVTSEWVVACAGFEALGSNAAPAVPALIMSLDDTRAGVRSVAAKCLASVGPAASNAGPRLVTALDDPDPEVQSSALLGLAHISGDPDVVVPGLIAYLEKPRDDSPRAVSEKRAAIYAFFWCDRNPSSANLAKMRSALSRLTNASNAEIRWEAWKMLKQLGSPPRSSLPDYYR